MGIFKLLSGIHIPDFNLICETIINFCNSKNGEAFAQHRCTMVGYGSFDIFFTRESSTYREFKVTFHPIENDPFYFFLRVNYNENTDQNVGDFYLYLGKPPKYQF